MGSLSPLSPRRAWRWLLGGCGLYILAYLHGQSTSCSCDSAAPAVRPVEREQLEMIPSTERAMVECILLTVEARTAVRNRMYKCLKENAYLGSALPADVVASSALPPPLPSGASASPRADLPLPPEARGDAGARRLDLPAAAVASASAEAKPVASRAQEEPEASLAEVKDPLLRSLEAARLQEEELPSAPLASAASVRVAQLPAALVAEAASSRMVRITCVANGRFFSLEPGKDWIECGGEEGVTPLHSGLFAVQSLPNEQLAFRHALTGKYLQVVPPGGPLAWVVRVHETSIGEAERFELKPGKGDMLYLYNVGAACHINHRVGFVLRGHGNKPGRPASKLPSARLTFKYYDLSQLRAAYAEMAAAELAARRPIAEQLSRIRSLGASNEVRVISYGLYGADTRYTNGVLRNAQLAPLVYPGWKMRVYLDGTVPPPVVAQLERLGVQLVRMDDKSVAGGIGGMFWRFLVAADPGVDRFIVRDSDSRLNPRERLAVEEWIASGLRVHSLRDHPNHDRPLNGGMWGGVRGAVPDMRELVAAWSNRDAYMGDLDFLNQKVWPRANVKGSQMSHDAYSCSKYPNARPFPTRRPPDFQHVGQVFFGDGRARQGDITDFMLNRVAPRFVRFFSTLSYRAFHVNIRALPWRSWLDTWMNYE